MAVNLPAQTPQDVQDGGQRMFEGVYRLIRTQSSAVRQMLRSCLSCQLLQSRGAWGLGTAAERGTLCQDPATPTGGTFLGLDWCLKLSSFSRTGLLGSGGGGCGASTHTHTHSPACTLACTHSPARTHSPACIHSPVHTHLYTHSPAHTLTSTHSPVHIHTR